MSAVLTALLAPLRNRRILIVGFTNLTGRSVALAFDAAGIRYRISDLKERVVLEPQLSGLCVSREDVLTGPQLPHQLDGIDLVVLSPGVPRSIELIRAARQRGIAVVGDVDLAASLVPQARIIGITGTDGKTTTTTLVGRILGERAVVGGNIGVPIFSRLPEVAALPWTVLELSSYMLEEAQHLRPRISTVLNVAPDHMDRYGSMDDYLSAKLNVARACSRSDVFVLNLDDPAIVARAPHQMKVMTYSCRSRRADCHLDAGVFRFSGGTIPLAECRLQAPHLAGNLLAAMAIGVSAGIPSDEIVEAVRTFAGLPHRFRHLGTVQGVHVIDDSKATTVHAVRGALRSAGGNAVLILGGRDKKLDFAELRPELPRAARVVAYGEAGPRILHQLGGGEYRERFEDAVALAAARCKDGCTLLLSPGCTSWDQFDNYETRGKVFREVAFASLGRQSAGIS